MQPSKLIKIKGKTHPRGAFNELYVVNKRPKIVYLKHAQKIIEKGIKTILIHGMQASIHKALDIALTLQDNNPDMTQEIVSDTIPTLVEEDGKRKIREVSAIHITLCKKLSF